MIGKHLIYGAVGFVVALVITSTVFLYVHNKRNYIEIIAVTGATPLAVKEDVGKGFLLEVAGDTEKVYRFDRGALNAFASTYVRTHEVSLEGDFEGTYRYTGIPVLHILEGVAPKKPEGAPFDRPLDVVVTFISESGESRHFSFGELTMTDDSEPVILAYKRNELLPAKSQNGEEYKYNIHKEPLNGLRLVCPAEPDTARYLDNVIRIVYSDPVVDNKGLPVMQQGLKCSSEAISIVKNGVSNPLSFEGVETASIDGWVRTGHGRGFKVISSARGYNMRSLLKNNFPEAGPEKFFLFVACDGYRTLFSGREIFKTEAGRRMMLVNEVDGKPVRGGASLGPVKDYYVDRETWGLTHIIMLDNIN
ncbi:MAG: hypothetical protein GX654_15210 [Desulfatiglans sp.]|nr:hypothetical protein [Desulfatiglans sp.]